MKKKITAFLAFIVTPLFSFATISEAKILDANQALSAKQQSIVTIAAFTANGNMEKLKIALNEGLEAGLAQIRSLISILKSKVGKKEADNANEILGKVLSNRAK